MKVKEVFAVRVNKGDIEIREYLKQFPVYKQNNAVKELLKFGVQALKHNHQTKQTIETLHDKILNVNKEQNKKLEKIIELLKKGRPEMECIHEEEKDNGIDLQKARNTMKEALAMFQSD